MKKHISYHFLALVAILLVFGATFLSVVSSIASLNAFGNTHYYIFHQLIAIAIGLVIGFIIFKIPLDIIKKFIPILLLINLILVVIVLVPSLGTKFWGAKRWIIIGGTAFQPSEFLKVTSILYLALLLSKRSFEQTKTGWISAAKKSYNAVTKVFVPFLLLLVVIFVILFLQKDLSTLGVITIALLAVYFSANTPLWHMVLTVGGMISAAAVAIRIEPFRFERLMHFLKPEQDPLGIGFQLKQSLLAIGSGGIFGKGLGMSDQKFGFLPQSMTDSMFAILGEETGIIGCAVLVILFAALFWQGIRIAKSSGDAFGRLAVIGIVTWIVVQAFLNICSSIGIWPLSGLPLPFFSYGGSHALAELIGVAIILNISKHA